MKIRRAVFHDLPGIIDIYAMDAPSDAWTILRPQAFDKYRHAFFHIDQDPNQLLLVAENGEAIIGTLQITTIQHLLPRSLKRAIIEALFIDERYQGRGIGTLLVQEAENWARANGCVSLELTSNKIRATAHQFYRKLDFSASREGFKKRLV